MSYNLDKHMCIYIFCPIIFSSQQTTGRMKSLRKVLRLHLFLLLEKLNFCLKYLTPLMQKRKICHVSVCLLSSFKFLEFATLVKQSNF